MPNQDAEPIDVERDCDSDGEIEDEDSWDEMEMEQEPTKCLFCDEIGSSIEKAIEHMEQQHHISLSAIKRKFNLDQFSYVKMINYIKTHKLTADDLTKTEAVLWSDDKYMKPVEVDPWLMFDIEDLKDAKSDSTTNDAHKIESLQRELREKDAMIEQLLEQITHMKTMMSSNFHEWVDRLEKSSSPSTANGTTEKADSGEKTVAKIPIEDDESYFVTYAHFDIHYNMLSDTVRTSSYRDAIINNRDSFENKLVVDLGCGTSILSMFSSQAGAKKVLAVDQSEIIYHAMDIAQRNNVTNIEFVKGRLENMDLPLAKGEKVDIIVSEWMGYFLLFEGMLDSVIHARDKYLKPGGLLLPNRCTINLLGMSDVERHDEYIGFWKNVYGYDMSTMQSKVLQEAIVEECRGDYIISDPVVIADLNMLTVDYTYPNFEYEFELKIRKTTKFTAFVGYFDTFFDLPQKVEFTTGPHSKSTHWKQVIFYLKDPVNVSEGDVVRGQFQCSRGKKDARALYIKITAFGKTFRYGLN